MIKNLEIFHVYMFFPEIKIVEHFFIVPRVCVLNGR